MMSAAWTCTSALLPLLGSSLFLSYSVFNLRMGNPPALLHWFPRDNSICTVPISHNAKHHYFNSLQLKCGVLKIGSLASAIISERNKSQKYNSCWLFHGRIGDKVTTSPKPKIRKKTGKPGAMGLQRFGVCTVSSGLFIRLTFLAHTAGCLARRRPRGDPMRW